MKPYKVSITKDNQTNKKYKAIFFNKSGQKIKTIRFGADGYQDYTQHKNPERKKNYIARHRKNENWNNPMTAGTLAKDILWNKTTISASIKDYKQKFNLK